MFIYVITNRINGKTYVGYDTGPVEKMRRWHLHCALKKPKHESKLFNAMLKYGIEQFFVEVVARASTNEELKQLEKDWIKKLNSIQNGYNIRSGGQGFGLMSEMTPEDAAKQLEAMKRGAKRANELRWRNLDADQRKAALEKCHKSYSSKARSENMKRIWAERRAAHG